MEPVRTRLRLSAMMFGIYLVVGAWAVTLGTYLISSPPAGGLAFSAHQVGWIYTMWAFGGMAAPVFIGLLADRLFPAQRLLAIFSLAGAALLVGVACWCRTEQVQIESVYRSLLAEGNDAAAVAAHPRLLGAVDHAFGPLLGLMGTYCFCCVMSIGCSNVVGFRNLAEPQKNYGRIRLYGTVGWIVAGLAIAATGQSLSHVPLYFAAAVSALVGVYSLTLPHTPPLGNGKTLGEAFGLPALTLFRQRPFCILLSSVFCMSTVQQFYGVYANKYLTDLHAPAPTGVQTLAQVSEVACMAFLPWIVDRFGLRLTMLVGLVCWTLRNALFCTAVMPVVVYVGLPIHGICFTCFFVVAMIYVDRQAPRSLRASSQGIFTFISSGMGVLTGNTISALVVEGNTHGGTIDWPPVWIVPTLMSLGVCIYFGIGFRPSGAPVHLREGEAGRHAAEGLEEIGPGAEETDGPAYKSGTGNESK